MLGIYTAYAPDADITFIMADIANATNQDLISTECVGWYYGEPNPENTLYYIHKLKATY